MSNQAIEKSVQDVEQVVLECGIVALKEQPALMQAINLARGVKALKAIITKELVESVFLPLQNTPLGFLTDKADGGYDGPTVRECVIEGLLRGFRPVGNEMNIIAGRFYGTKNGFERIVLQYPGVSNVELDLGVPRLVADKGAVVPCEARWTVNGKKMVLYCGPPREAGGLDTSIPIKVNSGMAADAILGKATRKLYARIYQRLTGCASDIIDAEGEGLTVPAQSLPAPADPSKDGQRIKMNGNKRPDAAHDPVTGEVPMSNDDRQPGVD
jgi:hypothetical protein